MSEVAKAAERLRELQGSELFSVEPDGDKRAIATRGIGVTWELWQKCKAVIRWALPLWDGVEITAPWLEAVGFKFCKVGYYWPTWANQLTLVGQDGECKLIAGRVSGEHVVVATLKTRGDLRRLASALGIPLKEPPQP